MANWDQTAICWLTITTIGGQPPKCEATIAIKNLNCVAVMFHTPLMMMTDCRFCSSKCNSQQNANKKRKLKKASGTFKTN